MIVECEICHTKFRLDDKLLKETGSKVRCSVCNYKFMVFPPKADKKVSEGPAIDSKKKPSGEEFIPALDKTIVADDVIGEIGKSAPEKSSEFDKTLEGKAPQEDEIEPISFEDISQIDSGIIRAEAPDIGKAMERATKVEEELIAKEEQGKGEEFIEPEEPVLPTPLIKKRRRPGVLLTVLVLILLLAAAGSALVFFMPELLPESIPFLEKQSKEQALDMGNKRLSFSNLQGSFVDSSTAGKLFVVTGSVANHYPDTRDYIRVRSNILDSKGTVAKSKIVYAGNPLSTDDLKTLSVEEINRKLMNRAGRDNINMNIAPNASVPFMIVFENLPEDVSEFTVEAISSSPTKR
jgi:predicted Zn finger-like uncharacterized protein